MAFDWSISGYSPLFVRVFIWLLITHWELLISLHLNACLGVCFYWGHWHVDYDACLFWLRIPIMVIFPMLHCYYLFETSICYLYWLTILPCLAHLLWFCHDCSNHSTCIHSPLYITRFDMSTHLLVYYLDYLWAWYLYHYSSDCHSLYVDTSGIFCTLLDCMSHDCPPLRDCMLLVRVGRTPIPLSLTL